MKKILFGIVALLLAASCTQEVVTVVLGDISGVVADKTTGDPVGSVSLTLSPGGAKTVTGSDGAFLFVDLEAGSYTIDLEKEGYKRESTSVVVFEGKRTDAHLLIERIPAVITADRDVLDFGDNASVTQLSVSIVNPGYLDLHWSVSWDTQIQWIREIVGPDGKSEGTLAFGKTASLVIRIDRDALASGYNEAIVVIWSDNGCSELKVTATGADRRMALTNVLPVTEYDMTSAVLKARMENVGAPEYEERGFVLSTSSIKDDASLSDLLSFKSQKDEQMDFSATATGLNKGTLYYVRAYAKNPVGTKYSANEEQFSTIGALTEVKTLDAVVLDVVTGKVQFNGEITVAGQPAYSEKGFVYNTTGEPVTEDKKVTVSGNGSGQYNYLCVDLTSQTTFYVRAYAIQNGKVFYGSTVVFDTNQIATEVTTSAASSVTSSSAVLNGSVTTVGNPVYSEKGFCYSSSNTEPTITDSKVVVTGNEGGNYEAAVENLPYGVTYYYRAYAIQNGVPVYGEIVSFTTEYVQSEVTSSAASSITSSSAILNGTVTKAGIPVFTEKGFCYGKSNEPTTSDTKVVVTGNEAGDYSTTIENLPYGTTYYYRAYVIQSDSPIYGEVISFTTAYTKVGVTTGTVSNVKETSAKFLGTITNVGDPKYTERGFCYGTGQNPTVSNSKVSNYVVATGNWNAEITGLSEGTTYYVRAYAIQDGKEVYGNQQTFTTIKPPAVQTSGVSDLTKNLIQWKATFSGYVSQAGVPAYKSRGFVYGTSYDPTVGSGTSVTASGSGSTGSYSATVSNLSNMQTYYVRAWVKSASGGYVYGNSISFSTY